MATINLAAIASGQDVSLPPEQYAERASGVSTEAYQGLIGRAGETQAVKLYQDRLSRLDELSHIIVESFDSMSTLMFNKVLPDGAGTKPVASIPSAADLLADYQAAFDTPLSAQGLADQDIDLLRNHYTHTIDLLTHYICERGRVAAALDGASADPITELCVVIPFLNRSVDKEWSSEDCRALPDWLREDAQAARIEFFSLRIGRPYTAYQIHDAIVSGKTTGGDQQDLVDYFLSASERLDEAHEYVASIKVLRAAIFETRSAGNFTAEVKARLRISEILDNIGHTQLAADEVLEVLSLEAIEPDLYGRASVLRLKYLYALKKNGLITEEYPAYYSDPRCEPYLPQLMYIMWVALRYENHAEKAAAIEDEFLSRYPDHALLPDIYFSRAMSAMARSDYDEANRLLEVIEYRFPNYRNIDQVNNLRRRLSVSMADQDANAGE